MYLLDTNICIYALKNRYRNLTEKLLSIHPEKICISAITAAELEYGAAKSRWGEQTRLTMRAFLSSFTILPFEDQDAVIYGRLRAELAAAGTPIGPYDLMIAAQAVSRGLTVVTHNMAEFDRVPGIRVEDWTEKGVRE